MAAVCCAWHSSVWCGFGDAIGASARRPALTPHAPLRCLEFAGGGLRLRGGYNVGAGAGAFSDASRGIADEDEFFRKFGSGPGHMDLSSSKFEVKPDSFNDPESLMDGMGMWDHPEEYRLLGEHIPPRVGHRVRTSPYLRVSRPSHARDISPRHFCVARPQTKRRT